MKKIIWILASIAVIAIGVFAYIVFKDIYQAAEENEEDYIEESEEKVTALAEERSEVQGAISDEELEDYEAEGLNPFGKSTAIEELTSYHYKEYIHGMSHQKVIAEEKWGFYEIHSDRIRWLLEGLDVVDIENESIYKSILERWEQGDFSKVDNDHNTIWDLQGGTIGRATGILSPEDEQAYIDSKQ